MKLLTITAILLIVVASLYLAASLLKRVRPQLWERVKALLRIPDSIASRIGLFEAPLRYGRPQFADEADDRFTDFKYKERMPSDEGKEAFQGLLPKVDPEADAFVPSLEQAAERPFGGELGEMKSIKNYDLRGYSADEVIQPSDVVPFGQSTLASANGMGIGQPSYSVDTVAPAPLLTSFAKNMFK